MFYLKTLGELSLHASGPKGPPLLRNSKPLAVLAYLATMPDHSARRDHLAQLLWPESDTNHGRSSLRQALHYITQRVGRPLVQASDSTISLDGSLLDVDIWEFDRELEEEDYAHAVELYAGPFVPGLERKAGAELEEWIESEDERLRAGLDVAYTRLVADAMARGWPSTAVEYARLYVELNPLNEVARLAYVRALKAAGDQVGALRTYRSYRSLLREALHDEPSDELERAIASVRDEVLKEPSQEEVEAEGLRVRRKVVRWAVAGAGLGAAATIVALFTSFAIWGVPDAGGDIELGDLSGDFFAYVGIPRKTDLARATPRASGLRMEITDYPVTALPSPDREHVAVTVAGDDGWNLAVIERSSGDTRVLTDAPHDEEPRAWSPDSRFILYRQGTLLDGGADYSHQLKVYDLRLDLSWTVSRLPTRGAYGAAWSPDGTRIAFVATPESDRDLFVAETDGSNPVKIAHGLAEHGRIAWSPDSRHIAFVSDQSGSSDIHTILADGSDLRAITESAADESTPLWLSQTVIAYVRQLPDGSRDVWATDTNGGPTRQLTQRGDVYGLVPSSGVGGDRSWVGDVAIVPAIETVTPGQYLSLEVEIADAAGRPIDVTGLPVHWSVSDTRVASFEAPQLLKVHAAGSADLMASVGGWVADTLHVRSRQLMEGPVTLLFFEDWSQGIRGDRWIRWGDPLPLSRSTGGPEGAGVFINNGDHHYSSGVVSRQAFGSGNGLTVEFWARMPFTGKLYQHFGVGLVAGELPRDSTEWQLVSPDIEFRILGPNQQTGASAAILVDGAVSDMPWIPSPEDWHHYALQLDRGGGVGVLIDGRLYWRLPTDLSVETLPPFHVVLGHRSVDAEVAHGLLRVYYGSKYLLPDEAASGSLSLAR